MDKERYATMTLDRQSLDQLTEIARETHRSRPDVIRFLLAQVRVVNGEIRLAVLQENHCTPAVGET